MNAWQQLSMIWERNPVFRVEVVWLIIAIVVSTAAVAWAVTFIVMSFRTKIRTRKEYPDNVVLEVVGLEAELAVALAANKFLKNDSRQLRYLVKVVREAVITEPTRMLTEETP